MRNGPSVQAVQYGSHGIVYNDSLSRDNLFNLMLFSPQSPLSTLTYSHSPYTYYPSRVNMLRAFSFLSFALQALFVQGGQSLECRCVSPMCRCFSIQHTNHLKSPSEPCWPSDALWTSLNASIDGRLIRTSLPAAVCYPSEPNYDREQCNQIIQEWATTPFHSSDPTSIHNPTSANNSCNPIYPNGTSTAGDPLAGARGCSLGMYPPFVVNATEMAHVQEAVKFAKRWNLRLSIKNTGHSGKTAVYGSLSYVAAIVNCTHAVDG